MDYDGAWLNPLSPFTPTFREYLVVFNGNHRPQMYGPTGWAGYPQQLTGPPGSGAIFCSVWCWVKSNRGFKRAIKITGAQDNPSLGIP